MRSKVQPPRYTVYIRVPGTAGFYMPVSALLEGKLRAIRNLR